MQARFLVSLNENQKEPNIFADKSALILEWLLTAGIKKEKFSLREVSSERKVSIGLVQRVFHVLAQKGFLETEGVRTTKRFLLKEPKLLLESWLENYNITKKCKLRTYQTGFSSKKALIEALKRSKLQKEVVLALHAAAEVHGWKNTNIETLELYLLNPLKRTSLEKLLDLEPQERGYSVLIIEPYYKSLLERSLMTQIGIKNCLSLLNFLDLYHFPTRGREQAEYIKGRSPLLKEIYGKVP